VPVESGADRSGRIVPEQSQDQHPDERVRDEQRHPSEHGYVEPPEQGIPAWRVHAATTSGRRPHVSECEYAPVVGGWDRSGDETKPVGPRVARRPILVVIVACLLRGRGGDEYNTWWKRWVGCGNTYSIVPGLSSSFGLWTARPSIDGGWR
jgi:hypothetical protein